MATATLALSAIEPETRLRALDSLSLASALAAAVKRRANSVSIAWNLWKADGVIKNLLERVNGILEGTIEVKPAAEPVTRSQIVELIDTLDLLARTIDYTREAGQRLGLTNNSLTAGSLKSLVAHREGLLDVADWLDASLKTDETLEILTRAGHERDAGQTFDLDQVR